MADAWPSSLPDEPLKQGFQLSEGDYTDAFDPDVGPPILRARHSIHNPVVKMSIEMDTAQLATFRTFWQTTLAMRSKPFEWLDFTTSPRATCEYRILETPQVAPAPAHGFWDVTLTLLKVA